MFGFWEMFIILGILGYVVYSYFQKKEKQIEEQKKKKIREEDIIDLDEDSYEIMDD